VNPTFSTFLQLLGFSFGMFLLARYRLWKANRAEIPLDFNPKTGVYEPDLKLKRWERIAKVALWVWVGSILALGYLFVTNFDPALVSK